jgi:phage terminase large subunit
MPIPYEFNFKHPDYLKAFKFRYEKLCEIRRSPSMLPNLYGYYKSNIAQFITDWGMTVDPRNVERGLPASIPFLLYPRQEEYVNWVIDSWKNKESVVVEKSRDMGITWLSVAIACSLCLFNHGTVIGFGSRKEDYVDKLGDLDSIMEKARMFLTNLPLEFRGGWNLKQFSKEMLIMIPQTKATIKGEAGNNIGRGGRTSIYFVDEAAFLTQPELIEASLSATTNCRIDVSTPHGMGNPFAQKRHSGRHKVFTFGWRDDPRKDDTWYQRMKFTLDPITLAQEVDLNYAGSVDGVVIPANWVYAAIDAHVKLKISKSGYKRAALDLADEGKDKNAFCLRHGIVMECIDEWSGKDSDILESVEKAIRLCIEHQAQEFFYDAEGIGAGARGDARHIKERLNPENKPEWDIQAKAFRGSAKVWMPTSSMTHSVKNEDLFANYKAQAWWQLRIRFQNTFRAVTEGIFVDPGSIISLPSNLKNLNKLVIELSQPTYSKNGAGKLIVDKKPKGTISPNLGDAVMMAFHEANNSIQISKETLALFARK